MYITSTSRPLRQNIALRKHTLPATSSRSHQNSVINKMSCLTYVKEHGAGQKHSDLGHYSQAVIIGNIAKLASQGGWDNDGNLDQYDWKQQIKNAFENVDRVLQAAGFRGWEDVSVAIVSFDLDSSDEIVGLPPPQLPARYRQPVGVPCRDVEEPHTWSPADLDRSECAQIGVSCHVGGVGGRGYQA